MAKKQAPRGSGKPAGSRRRRSDSSASQAGSGSRTPAALRRELDRLDQQLIALVAQRCALVTEAVSTAAPRSDSADTAATAAICRVAEAYRRAGDLAAQQGGWEGVPVEAVADLLRHVASLGLRGTHVSRVAYLGPPHSYSHLAALKFFGPATPMAPVASIEAVFESVLRRDCFAGIVPIENSTDGRVVDTLGMFSRTPVEICAEVLLPIHHNLLSRSPREAITEVYSKPQALSQCRGWLARHLPAARLVEIGSTAAAAQLAAEKEGAAAIASHEAGRHYALEVVDQNIEDNPHNVTRFAVLGQQPAPASGDDKTSLLFRVDHQPGALADAMAIFKRQQLNLTWIESFPLVGSPSEYLFFIEMEGHRDDPAVAAAIAALGKRALRLDLLGSYPRDRMPLS